MRIQDSTWSIQSGESPILSQKVSNSSVSLRYRYSIVCLRLRDCAWKCCAEASEIHLSYRARWKKIILSCLAEIIIKAFFGSGKVNNREREHSSSRIAVFLALAAKCSEYIIKLNIIAFSLAARMHLGSWFFCHLHSGINAITMTHCADDDLMTRHKKLQDCWWTWGLQTYLFYFFEYS